MQFAPRSGEAMNGRAIVIPSLSSGLDSRPKPVRTTPGCAQLAVTPVPPNLRARSRVNKIWPRSASARRDDDRRPLGWRADQSGVEIATL